LPRLLHLPAPPGFRFGVAPYSAPSLLSRRPIPQVSPCPRAFGCAGDLRSSCPEHRFLRRSGFSEVLGFPSGSRFLLLRLRSRSQVAPRPVSPALPAMDRRVTSILTSFGGAGCESSGLPLPFALPVSPTISIRVAPNAHLPAPADGMSESPRIAHHPVRLG